MDMRTNSAGTAEVAGRDSYDKFTGFTISLHWIIAITMIGMLAFGLYLEDLPRGPEKSALIGIHKSIGLTILVLAAVRFGWRLINGMPQPVGRYSAIERILAKVVHWLLLLGTLFMPISGILMSLSGGHGLAVFGLEIVPVWRSTPGFEANKALGEAAGAIHGLGGKLLIAAIVLHFTGALKHHVIDKDATLRRMLGGRVSA